MTNKPGVDAFRYAVLWRDILPNEVWDSAARAFRSIDGQPYDRRGLLRIYHALVSHTLQSPDLAGCAVAAGVACALRTQAARVTFVAAMSVPGTTFPAACEAALVCESAPPKEDDCHPSLTFDEALEVLIRGQIAVLAQSWGKQIQK